MVVEPELVVGQGWLWDQSWLWNQSGCGTRLVVVPELVVVLRKTEAERSFSILKRIKNYSRSTMCQMRLTSLGKFAVESELAKHYRF